MGAIWGFAVGCAELEGLLGAAVIHSDAGWIGFFVKVWSEPSLSSPIGWFGTVLADMSATHFVQALF